MINNNINRCNKKTIIERDKIKNENYNRIIEQIE